MDDLRSELSDLFEKVNRTRYEFLKTEVQTCFTGLDMGRHVLSVGNKAFALREAEIVETGIRTARRFLAGVSDSERTGIEAKLSELDRMLDALKADLGLVSSGLDDDTDSRRAIDQTEAMC
jgi:hypothetical protein